MKKKKQIKEELPKNFSPLLKGYLFVLLILFSFLTIFFFFIGDVLINYYEIDPPTPLLTLFSILSILSFIATLFAIFLIAKKKMGFWGLTLTLLFSVYFIAKVKLIFVIIPIFIILLTFGFLQLKYKKITGWKLLK